MNNFERETNLLEHRLIPEDLVAERRELVVGTDEAFLRIQLISSELIHSPTAEGVARPNYDMLRVESSLFFFSSHTPSKMSL